MKKLILILASIFCTISNAVTCEELATKITHVNATGYPIVEAMLQVYYDNPLELATSGLVIEENGSKIAEFSLLPQSFTHYMVLLLDRSSSIESAMPDVKKAAAGLIENLAGSICISVMSFGSDIDIDHDFSNDKKSLASAIAKIRPWGGTALFDALYDSCEELNKKAGLNDIKTIVCLTDGQDSTPSGQHRLSRREPQEVSKIALESNIRVINLGLGNDIDADFLGSIASETEGWYLQTATSDQLANLCDNLSRRLKLKKHYKLSYNSPLPLTESPRRNIKITLLHNSLRAESNRPYHIPTQVKALTMATSDTNKTLNINELLHHFKIGEPDRSDLTDRLQMPHIQPVYCLTLAAFNGLSSENCRNLINQGHQQVGQKHQQNFDTRKSYLDKYLNCVDRLLQQFYSKGDAPGTGEIEGRNIARFIEFLNFRREEIVTQTKQAYEEYLIDLKFSQAELEYFEKTQIGREPFSEAFFAGNTASRTLALQQLSNQYVELLAENQQKFREKFSASGTTTEELLPASAGKNLDFSMPRLPTIKTLD